MREYTNYSKETELYNNKLDFTITNETPLWSF